MAAVQKALPNLIEDFGKTDPESVRAKLKIYKSGRANRSTEMELRSDVPAHVSALEKLRDDMVLLFRLLPAVDRVEEECLTDDYLSKICIDSMHSLYAPAIQRKRERLHQNYMAIELTTNAQRKAEAEKGDAAWKEYPIPSAELRTLLAEEYLHNSKLWESNNHKVYAFNAQDRKNVRSSHLHGRAPYSFQPREKSTRSCCDCGLEDCRFGNPNCTNKGALLNAPQFI